MKLKMLLMATCLLLPMSPAFSMDQKDKTAVDYQLENYKKDADIGDTEAAKKYDQLKDSIEKAKADDPEAEYELALVYMRGSSYYDKDAEKLLLSAANQGYIKAQYYLVKWYMSASKGHLKDINFAQIDISNSKEKMLFWMNKLIEEGDPKMQNFVGQSYVNGEYGFQKNYNKAKVLFEKSADQGYPSGITNLAKCYQNGWGVSKNINKAISLYEQAGQKGDGAAYMRLGDIYESGNDGVLKDLYKAKNYNEKARQLEPRIYSFDMWLEVL